VLRRIRPVLTIGSGVYWIVMAFLLPLVVYPKVAVLPLDPKATQIMHGTGFNVLVPRSADQGGLKVYRNVPVTVQVFVSADDSQPRPNDSPNAFWRIATTTSVDGVVPQPHEVYTATFPFGTQQQDYPLWDASIKGTATAKYTAKEKRRGLNTYRFELYIDEQKIGTQALPGDLFGLKTPSVVADSMFRTHRTYWVEPSSGAIVDYREAMDRRFVFFGTTIPAIQGTVTMIPDDTTKTFRQTKLAAIFLPLLKRKLPLVFALLGLVMIAFGVSRLRRNQRLEEEAHHRHRDDDPDTGRHRVLDHRPLH
jgi:hypothetical protein